MPIDSVLIVGATSAIAHETARALVGRTSHFVLAARNAEHLAVVAADLRNRGAKTVHTLHYDAESHVQRDLLAEAADSIGTLPDAVLIAHGVLPRHEEVVHDSNAARSVLQINTVSVLALCTDVSRHFEQRGSGLLAVISSVAADRGRMQNYLYSASKAALDVYLDGLRLRWKTLSPALRVLTIKPGYVRTPMTAHLEHMILPASPDSVGRRIARAMLRRKGGRMYVPWWWALVAAVLRRLPEPFMLLVRQ
ncbi:MAG: SDR family NAD(P)-dependent oxidoreductase [Bacteroidota bacterium]|nr:SDR family NAD(P)-dependent oxidoreductase [Candidatus Kapabacteria bacterium]MCS7301861.1 SDR family NAD(P)-dependent oxidoreductase [Candidatus Kapabacteria bacterium]MCX7936114.1 SDR family NAD(P)-dependent oxidoreductase [Chlorobiota bacterium]MDW8074992.1 SDR family NAD(P)-dependent oxidoreductase [Bacteroidota bacterium]MDW8271631.1 SDR family NAD(P)-dependent oxidoreductase [Bacteroidota bacterium]